MRVTPEQSTKVQKILFKSGYTWLDGTQKTMKKSAPYLAFDESDGDFSMTLGIVWEFGRYKTPELTYLEFITLYDL